MAQAIARTRLGVLPVKRNTEKILVLLTDGEPTCGIRRTRTQAELAKEQGIRLIAIGVGRGVDSEFLKQIASPPEDYHFAEQSLQLESTFAAIGSRLVTESSGSGGLSAFRRSGG